LSVARKRRRKRRRRGGGEEEGFEAIIRIQEFVRAFFLSKGIGRVYFSFVRSIERNTNK
jgi:hypothetical protein